MTEDTGYGAESPLQRQVRLETPEHVRLDYDLADLGSRFAAGLLDAATIVAALLVVSLGAALVGQFTNSVTFASGVGLAVVIFVAFLIVWCYFLIFEAYWDGQTPGKRVLGLRVLHSGGQPLTFRGSVVRNLVRIVDLMPLPTFLTGGLAVVFSRRAQGLGDMAGDTIVVKDAGQGRILTSKLPTMPSATARPRLPDEHFQLLDDYRQRQGRLNPEVRRRVTGSVLKVVRAHVDADPRYRDQSAEVVLARLHEEEASRRAGAMNGWNLQAAALIRSRLENWESFRAMVRTAKKRGLKALPDHDLRKFGRLYRGLTADLARARAYRAPAGVLFVLGKWAAAGHNLFYRAQGVSVLSVRRWLGSGLPRTVRAHWRSVSLASVLLYGPGVAMYAAVQSDPALGRAMVPAGMVEMAENTDPGDSYFEMSDAGMPVLASNVMTNNLRVASMAFAGGVLAGAGTVFILVFNGLFLGSAFGLYANEQVLPVLLAFVLPHGVIELTAICLAGAAGLGLGSALLVPGRRTRVAALAERARVTLSLLGGAAVFLVVAGVIEGFYSPSSLPPVAKFAFGGASAVVLVLYLGFAGRRGGRPTTAPAP